MGYFCHARSTLVQTENNTLNVVIILHSSQLILGNVLHFCIPSIWDVVVACHQHAITPYAKHMIPLVTEYNLSITGLLQCNFFPKINEIPRSLCCLSCANLRRIKQVVRLVGGTDKRTEQESTPYWAKLHLITAPPPPPPPSVEDLWYVSPPRKCRIWLTPEEIQQHSLLTPEENAFLAPYPCGNLTQNGFTLKDSGGLREITPKISEVLNRGVQLLCNGPVPSSSAYSTFKLTSGQLRAL